MNHKIGYYTIILSNVPFSFKKITNGVNKEVVIEKTEDYVHLHKVQVKSAKWKNR
jgi:hypothetical protein